MNKSSTFFDMPLSDGMKETITKIGFSSATPIQEQSIPELLEGFDLLGQAQTGTGKTAAFSIPLIELVNEQHRHIQALVVCPTRELCLQVCQEIKRLASHKFSLEAVAVYGGQAIEQQFKLLKTCLPQIIVATPGRLFDHLRRKSVDLSKVKMIVLDEADEMLDMGFRAEIEQIFEMLPEENQRIFFSATMPKAIKDLACSYLRNPKVVKTESKSLTVSTITQSYLRVRGREKVELLCRILDLRDPKLAVVFCNAKSTADELVDDIQARGFEAGVLHGDLSQSQRDRVMAKFKAGLVKVLVATDVAARGLDIDDVELVFNYHLPHDPEDYVHRIGRTGRAGRLGHAISLVEPRDNSRLRRISQFAKIEISEQHPPTMAEVKTAKIENLFAKVKEALASNTIAEYRSMITKQRISAEDIAAGMLQMAFKKFDNLSNEDIIFEDLQNKKYSGFSPENRFKERNGRRSEGGGFSHHRKPRSNSNDRSRSSDDRSSRSNDGRRREASSDRFGSSKPNGFGGGKPSGFGGGSKPNGFGGGKPNGFGGESSRRGKPDSTTGFRGGEKRNRNEAAPQQAHYASKPFRQNDEGKGKKPFNNDRKPGKRR